MKATASKRVVGLMRLAAVTLVVLQFGACGGRAALVTTTAASTADEPGSPPVVPQYNRRDWRHWIDDDRDCQDTRAEVLIAESETPVEFVDAHHCKVARGRWTCPYTGQVVTDPRKLDVDHLVPLENAHRSGGWHWSREKKRAYANNLARPEHLVAVVASANRSKGSRGPEEWLPPNSAFVCEYIREWMAVKTQWGLSCSDAEQEAVEQAVAWCSQ